MKPAFKLIAMVGVLGLLLGGFTTWYERYYGSMTAPIMAGVAIAIMVIFAILLMLPMYRLRKKMDKIVRILDVDHEPERYIKELKEIYKRKPAFLDFSYPRHQALIEIDIGLGYMALNQYQKAVKVFEKVDPNMITGSSAGAYYGFYAYSLFRTGRTNEGIGIMKENLPVLKETYEIDNIGLYINLSWIYQMLQEKRNEAVIFYWKKSLKTAWGYYQRRDLETMKEYLNNKGFDVETKKEKKKKQ